MPMSPIQNWGSDPTHTRGCEKIVKVCRDNGIRIAPQINLLGHQSWAETTYALLREYPEFDETPHVDTKNYTGWPNSDGLYCKVTARFIRKYIKSYSL